MLFSQIVLHFVIILLLKLQLVLFYTKLWSNRIGDRRDIIFEGQGMLNKEAGIDTHRGHPYQPSFHSGSYSIIFLKKTNGKKAWEDPGHF